MKALRGIMGNLRLKSSKLAIVCELRSAQSGKSGQTMAEAVVAEAVRHTIALQYDFDTGLHGERNDIPRDLTGAEGATAIDNNGGAPRAQHARQGPQHDRDARRTDRDRRCLSHSCDHEPHRARLVDAGTTNRTHMRDPEKGSGRRTAWY